MTRNIMFVGLTSASRRITSGGKEARDVCGKPYDGKLRSCCISLNEGRVGRSDGRHALRSVVNEAEVEVLVAVSGLANITAQMGYS